MNAEDNVASTDNYITRLYDSLRLFLSSISLGHPIHPLAPAAPEYSEFLTISPKIKLRIIHLQPGKDYKLINDTINSFISSKRSSLSEEYWFTKWNKSVKIGACSCSFRRSLRFSVISNQLEENRQSKLCFSVVPRITNIETFVERIVQDTCFEAFQEYYMLKNPNRNGTVNQAFNESEDEVVLRRPNARNKARNRQCIHKKMKPLIIMFHGIGLSSDVWSIVMNSLVNRGFEVVAPDLLGHGYSSAPDKPHYYTFTKFLSYALDIFDHYLGNDDKRKCILIGHSYGCSLITALYPHRASKISQIILISGGGPTPLVAPVKDRDVSPFGCIHTLFQPFIFCGMKRSFLFALRGKFFDVCTPETSIPNHILDYVKSGQNWPEGDAAFHRRIHVPTLLVHGLQDKKITLVQQCEMERTIPRAFLELIPNAGHLSMLETPEHLCHMIMCFIETWS